MYLVFMCFVFFVYHYYRCLQRLVSEMTYYVSSGILSSTAVNFYIILAYLYCNYSVGLFVGWFVCSFVLWLFRDTCCDFAKTIVIKVAHVNS